MPLLSVSKSIGAGISGRTGREKRLSPQETRMVFLVVLIVIKLADANAAISPPRRLAATVASPASAMSAMAVILIEMPGPEQGKETTPFSGTTGTGARLLFPRTAVAANDRALVSMDASATSFMA